MGNLYSKMKVFHYKDKLDSLPISNSLILPPVHIRMKPTNFCNHRCSYCAYRAEDQQLGEDMNERDFLPKEKMMEIIDDLVEMNVKAVTFSGGGEPFCYPYFTETIKKLSKTNIKFATLTNGSLLKGEIAKLFAQYAKWVRVSIDGWDDKSYAEYRSVKEGEFTKVIDNIINFKKLEGKCYLSISINVDKKNASHIYDLIQIFHKAKVNSVKISPCIISNDSDKNNKYHEEIFDMVKSQIAKAKNEFEADDFEIFDSYHTQLGSFKKDYDWCPYHQILVVIGADQNIYPCQDKAYSLETGLIGSIKNQRFKDFWFSDKNNFFRINPSKMCNHHCVANEKNKLVLDYLNVDKEHMDFV